MAWHTRTAVELLNALDAGEVTSVELVRALQARADATEAVVGGFTAQYREQALERAAQADAVRAQGRVRGPLHGLPVTIKENLALAGTPQTLGIVPRANAVTDTTAPVVQALLDAGAIVLGKSNVPQLLLAMESHNGLFGTTRNPWDAARVPGGSSGGEAALIAAGSSPLGVGTDIGGSIRNPAAWCGICGLKPTWGRWSVKGSAGGQPGQEAIRAQVGPLARTVGDLALLMQVIGPEDQHRRDPSVPPVPLPDPSTVDVSGLTVGMYVDDGVFEPAASVQRAVREAAAALEAAGATVVPYAPVDPWGCFDTYFGLLSADGLNTALGVLQGDAITHPLKTVARTARLPGAVRRAIAAGLGLAGERRVQRLVSALGAKTVGRQWELVTARNALQAAELQAWASAGIDVLIGPPSVTPPALHGETHDWSVGAWHTMRWNLLDHPAGIVPVTRVRDDEQIRTQLGDRLDRKAAMFEAGSAGLPVAAQVIGKPWEEHVVLAVMAAIEAARAGDPETPRTPVDPA